MSNNLFIPAVVTYADELVSGTLNSYNTFSSIHEADYYRPRELS